MPHLSEIGCFTFTGEPIWGINKLYTRTHMYTRVCVYKHTHAYIYTHTHLYICRQRYVCACAHVDTHTYTFAHIIHIYMRKEGRGQAWVHTHTILSSQHYEMIYFLHLTDEETESKRLSHIAGSGRVRIWMQSCLSLKPGLFTSALSASNTAVPGGCCGWSES